MADATILQAYKKLAESQADRADIAGSFTKALDLSGRKARKEKEIEELNQRVAERLETLDGNINLNAVDDPKLKSALSKFGTEYKYLFSDKANQVGHLNDPTSIKHMQLVDEMNGINDQFRAVRAEMDYISKMQTDYLTIVDEDGGFSVGQKNPEQVKALEEIFGGGGNYTVSVKDGHIVYNVGGKDYAAKDLKLPGRKAFDEAQALMASNAGLMSMGRALNAADEQLLRTQYDSMFKTESALRSILSDGDFGDIIPTSDIDIDEIGFEEAKTLFIDRLINANKASARRGIKTDKNNDSSDKDKENYRLPSATMNTLFRLQNIQKAQLESGGIFKNADLPNNGVIQVGPGSNPAALQIQYNPKTKQFKMYTASTNEITVHNSLEDLMATYGTVFYTKR